MNTNRTDIHKAFLQLVRIGIGTSKDVKIPHEIDWPAVKDLAERQGLGAVVLDGIEKLPEQLRPPKVFLLEWIGETLQGYEYRFEQYRKTISEMAALYNAHGLNMMVLKGYACSLDWPNPEHRPCGDIDIWQFGRYREGDKLVTSEKGIKIDSSHHHHTVFYWGEFMVENHFDFVNVYARRSSAEMEKVFKKLGSEANLNENDNQNSVGTRISSVEVDGEKVYLPSPNLHALFLMRHLVSHFVGAYISLRQVLDWAFFVDKHEKEVDWKWLEGVLEEFGMKEFYRIINAICVEDLGFEAGIFQGIQFTPELKDRILDDILEPAFNASAPRNLFPRLIYKYKRWQGNAWKQKLCYNESRWSSFWTGIWAKLLKPASI